MNTTFGVPVPAGKRPLVAASKRPCVQLVAGPRNLGAVRQVDEHGPRFLPQGAGDRGGKLEPDKAPHPPIGKPAGTAALTASADPDPADASRDRPAFVG